MKLSDIKKNFVKKVIKLIGDIELFPPQEEAIKTGFLDGKNLLLSSPTSSGKTLIAILGMMANLEKGGKSIYLVPLRSLAREKYEEFKKYFQNVGLSVGNLTRGDENLGKCDVIVCSYEKFDSLLRHGASWIKDVSLAVVDEIHLIDDVYRGPTLEILLTKLKLMKKWIIGLSATIGNPEEIGKWLNAIVVKSNFRPVKLLEGIHYKNIVKFKNDEKEYEAKDLIEICKKTLEKKKQILIFTSTRRNAESTAEKLSKILKLEDPKISEEILNALPSPTSQCRRLANCVKGGVAFNHAGLAPKQKQIIEDCFRKGILKIIVCTTVLAYGVSLPAYQVIIKDFKRYSNGLNYISISEYLQMAGRAGRSGYDTLGESIIIINNEADKEKAWESYLCASPLEITSKLSAEPILRTHILSLICDGFNTIEKILEFLKHTFFGNQYGTAIELKTKVQLIIEDLIDWGFVRKDNERYFASLLGKRVNELYIDPLSAHKITKALANLKLNELAFLSLACDCAEIRTLRVLRSDFPEIIEKLSFFENLLMQKVPLPYDYEYEPFLSAFKTALALYEWINEKGEDYLLNNYSLPPGMLHELIRNVEWILYSIGEIAITQGITGVREFTNGLILRVRYGVKADLLKLVSIKGIGKARARKLYLEGIKNIDDFIKNKEKVKKILGKVADKVFDELSS